ncbi:MAG TPA: hypothetical protein VG826_19270 [Pirellulales bacterium]|nr:hypothetical protein [Pirellulales bacterium]
MPKPADEPGVQFWLEQLAAGGADTDVVSGIVASTEYLKLHTA